jgi:hypothetical protein
LLFRAIHPSFIDRLHLKVRFKFPKGRNRIRKGPIQESMLLIK